MANSKRTSVKFILLFAFFLFILTSDQSGAATVNDTFFTDSSYDANARDNVAATIRFTGLNAYYYVENAYWEKLDQQTQSTFISSIGSLSNEFDFIIYPQMHQYYGTEWNPGIDNDQKIYILLTDIIKNAGGYYNPNDEYLKSQIKDNRSNEKEIIYLNANFIDKPNIKSFLAHEFQHMINWNQKKKQYNLEEDVWLNEALSEYAPTILGYDNIYKDSNMESRARSFAENPSDSLTEWKNTNQDYTSVNLFMQFLTGRYGNDVIKSIITAPKTGIPAINDAARKKDPEANFDSIFSDWIITNYFNGQTIQGKKYAYANQNLNYENLHIAPTSSFMVYSNNIARSNTAKSGENIKDWSGKWYQFISSPVLSVSNQTLKITFIASTDDANFQIPYVVKNTDGTLLRKNYALRGSQSGDVYIDNFGTAVSSVTIMPISERKTVDFTENETSAPFSYAASLVLPNQPSIKSISPKVSALGNRTPVTIIGENFTAGSLLKFGGIPATEINIIDSKTMVAKAPPSFKNGEVDVEITNPDLTGAIAPNSFAYLPAIKDGELIRAEGDYKVYVVTGKYKRWIRSEKIFGFYNFKWGNVTTVAPEIRDYYETSLLVRAANDYKVYEIGADNKKHHLSMSSAKFASSGRKWDMIFVINSFEKNSYKTGTSITK